MKRLTIHLYSRPMGHWQRTTAPERCREVLIGWMEVVDFRADPVWGSEQWRGQLQKTAVGPQDFPTLDKPVSLLVNRCGGNDNWALWFATVEEAQEVESLLLACQPLDWERDMLALGFVFVN